MVRSVAVLALVLGLCIVTALPTARNSLHRLRARTLAAADARDGALFGADTDAHADTQIVTGVRAPVAVTVTFAAPWAAVGPVAGCNIDLNAAAVTDMVTAMFVPLRNCVPLRQAMAGAAGNALLGESLRTLSVAWIDSVTVAGAAAAFVPAAPAGPHTQIPVVAPGTAITVHFKLLRLVQVSVNGAAPALGHATDCVYGPHDTIRLTAGVLEYCAKKWRDALVVANVDGVPAGDPPAAWFAAAGSLDAVTTGTAHGALVGAGGGTVTITLQPLVHVFQVFVTRSNGQVARTLGFWAPVPPAVLNFDTAFLAAVNGHATCGHCMHAANADAAAGTINVVLRTRPGNVAIVPAALVPLPASAIPVGLAQLEHYPEDPIPNAWFQAVMGGNSRTIATGSQEIVYFNTVSSGFAAQPNNQLAPAGILIAAIQGVGLHQVTPAGVLGALRADPATNHAAVARTFKRDLMQQHGVTHEHWGVAVFTITVRPVGSVDIPAQGNAAALANGISKTILWVMGADNSVPQGVAQQGTTGHHTEQRVLDQLRDFVNALEGRNANNYHVRVTHMSSRWVLDYTPDTNAAIANCDWALQYAAAACANGLFRTQRYSPAIRDTALPRTMATLIQAPGGVLAAAVRDPNPIDWQIRVHWAYQNPGQRGNDAAHAGGDWGHNTP